MIIDAKVLRVLRLFLQDGDRDFDFCRWDEDAVLEINITHRDSVHTQTCWHCSWLMTSQSVVLLGLVLLPLHAVSHILLFLRDSKWTTLARDITLSQSCFVCVKHTLFLVKSALTLTHFVLWTHFTFFHFIYLLFLLVTKIFCTNLLIFTLLVRIMCVQVLAILWWKFYVLYVKLTSCR